MNDDNKEGNGPEEKEKPGKAQQAANLVDTVKKIRTLWPIIAAAAPVIGWICLGFLIIILLMLPMLYFSQIIEGLATGLDKFINFITLEGWQTSEKVFFTNLQEEYDKFDAFEFKEGEFDVPLIAATVHYNKFVDPDGYAYEGEQKDYEYNDESPVVEPNKTRSFYVVANDELGSAYSLFFGEKKLVGHLVDTKFRFQCVNLPSGWDILNPAAWADLTGTIGKSFDDLWTYFKYALTDTGQDTVSRLSVIKFIQLIIDYGKQDKNYIASTLKGTGYEIINNNAVVDIIRIIQQSDWTNTCTSGQIPLPVIIKFINYDYYKDYLRNFYLPNQPYNTCATCEWATEKDQTKKNKIIEDEINEIFDQRDAYNYLQGHRTNNQTVQYVPGMSSLPIKVGAGERWDVNVARGFALGTAKCFENGVFTGQTNCNHLGIDFGYPTGTPVYAVADGDVLEAAFNAGGYGNYVKMGHDTDGDGKYNYYSLYGHLSKTYVTAQSKIGGGQQIGEVGSTGNSTGPHLHFEIMDSTGQRIDPAPILNGIQNGGSVLDTLFGTKYYNQGSYSNVEYCPGMLSDGAAATVQTSGCLPSSYAMIISRLYNDGTKDPAYVANYICTTTPSYRVEGSGTSSAFLTDDSVENYFKISATHYSASQATFDQIASILKSGKPIIVNVQGGTFNPSGAGHYLVLDKIDSNNNVKVLDPGSRSRTKSYTESEIKSELIPSINNGIWSFERSQ